MLDALEKERQEIREIVLIVKNMDKTGLRILKSQAEVIAAYEQLLKKEVDMEQQLVG